LYRVSSNDVPLVPVCVLPSSRNPLQLTKITKSSNANGNGGHTQAINQASLSNDTKVLEEEIIHMKREQALLQTQVAGLMQNNTVLKDKVMQINPLFYCIVYRLMTSHLFLSVYYHLVEIPDNSRKSQKAVKTFSPFSGSPPSGIGDVTPFKILLILFLPNL
jgi:hypothetical protein